MNPYKKYEIIPDYLLKAGYDLRDLGVFEIAWDKQTAISVIKVLKKKCIPLLGGDVYQFLNGEIKPTSDSWFYKDALSDDNYLKGEQYIFDYEKENGANFLYVPVWPIGEVC